MLGARMTPIDLQTGCNLARISVGTLGYQLACKDLATHFCACTDDVLSLSRGLKTGQYKKWASAKMAPNGYQRDATDAPTMATVTQWPLRQRWLGFWAILHSPDIAVPA